MYAAESSYIARSCGLRRQASVFAVDVSFRKKRLQPGE